MNRVFLYGNLGADPELKMTTRGTACLKIRMATKERIKKNNEWEDHTEWHRVVVWGARAEVLSNLLSKGSAVLVEGNIRTSSYEKDGRKMYSTEINASEVRLAGRREGGDGGGYGGGYGGGSGGQTNAGRAPAGDTGDGYEAPAQGPSYDDDDIPF